MTKDKQVCTCTETCQRRGKPFPTDWSWQCQGLPYIPTELDMREREQAIHSSSNQRLVLKPEALPDLYDALVDLYEYVRDYRKLDHGSQLEHLVLRALYKANGFNDAVGKAKADMGALKGRASEPPQPGAKAIDTGELWSFLRAVLSQGKHIHLDYTSMDYELYSARLDTAALERVGALLKLIGSASETGARPEKLETALRGLYWDQVDYLTLNHLGGMDNHWMKAAREALGIPSPPKVTETKMCTEKSHDDRAAAWHAVFDQLLAHNRKLVNGAECGRDCALIEIRRLQALDVPPAVWRDVVVDNAPAKTPVLTFRIGGDGTPLIAVAKWERVGMATGWHIGDGRTFLAKVTHWMALPAAPVTAEKAAADAEPTAEQATHYAFLWRRPIDSEPWAAIYTSRELAEAFRHRVSDVVQVRLRLKDRDTGEAGG